MAATPTKPAYLGPAFRAVREGARVTQQQVAEGAGISASTLSRFETGKAPITETDYMAAIKAMTSLAGTQAGAA